MDPAQVARIALQTAFGLQAAHEREIIIETLRRNGGNRARAATELGMHRTTLWRKIKSYGIA